MRTFAALSTKVSNTNEAEPVADRDHFLQQIILHPTSAFFARFNWTADTNQCLKANALT